MELNELPIILKVKDIYFNYIEESEKIIKILPALVTQTHSYNNTEGKKELIFRRILLPSAKAY